MAASIHDDGVAQVIEQLLAASEPALTRIVSTLKWR